MSVLIEDKTAAAASATGSADVSYFAFHYFISRLGFISLLAFILFPGTQRVSSARRLLLFLLLLLLLLCFCLFVCLFVVFFVAYMFVIEKSFIFLSHYCHSVLRRNSTRSSPNFLLFFVLAINLICMY